jgi:hypothetical protein
LQPMRQKRNPISAPHLSYGAANNLEIEKKY